MKQDMQCAGCGSAAVTRDAWAEWDAKTQSWQLGALFRTGYCHTCLKETVVVERALPDGPH